MKIPTFLAKFGNANSRALSVSRRFIPEKKRLCAQIVVFLAIFAAMIFPTTSRASVDFSLHLVHGYDFVYPYVHLDVNPAPTSYDRVESPNGLIWQNAGTNTDSSPFFTTNNLAGLVNECTNGFWKVYLEKGTPSESVYYFKLSLNSLTTNVFGDVEILFPLDGSSGVTNQPDFQWMGPSGFQSVSVQAYDLNYVTFFFDNLSVSETNWTASGLLIPGDNQFYISYTRSDFPGFSSTIPTNSTAQTLAGWTADLTLETYGFSTFSVVAPAGNSMNVAHYDFGTTRFSPRTFPAMATTSVPLRVLEPEQPSPPMMRFPEILLLHSAREMAAAPRGLLHQQTFWLHWEEASASLFG
jgi:hypothetical protein